MDWLQTIVNNSEIISDDEDVFNFTTTSPPEAAPQRTEGALVRVIVLLLMAILSTIGNVWTIWNIQKSRVAKKLTRQNCTAIYLLITHLSIADLLVTGFCMIGESVWSYTVQWLAGEFLCKSVKFAQMFSLYLSTYVLVLIGIDRLFAVKFPIRTANMGRQCKRFLLIVYGLSALFSLPQIFIFSIKLGPFSEEFRQCVTHGFYEETWQEQLYTSFTLLLMFVVPLCILIGTYLSTFRTISYSERRFAFQPTTTMTSMMIAGCGRKTVLEKINQQNLSNRQRLLQRAKYKSFKLSVVIILAFIVCWTPYYVMMVICLFLNPDKKLEEDLQSGIFFFGMSNSLVNPLIYGLFHLLPRKRRFFNSFQSSQTRTAIAEVSHHLIATNHNLISQKNTNRSTIR